MIPVVLCEHAINKNAGFSVSENPAFLIVLN